MLSSWRKMVALVAVSVVFCGCGDRALAYIAPIHSRNGIPDMRPSLRAAGVQLSVVDWRWASGIRDRSELQTRTPRWDSIPLLKVVPPLEWNTNVSPNMVNVTLLRHWTKRRRLNRLVIVRQCSVNVSYPERGGCTLGRHGTLRITWHVRSRSAADELLVSAMWIPLKLRGNQSSVFDHQATKLPSYQATKLPG